MSIAVYDWIVSKYADFYAGCPPGETDINAPLRVINCKTN